MTIRALIFDFGGVLVHMADTGRRQAWAQRLDVPVSHLEALVFDSDVARRAAVGLAPEIAVWQGLACHFGFNDATMQQFERDFWTGEMLDADLIALLRKARPHYHTAILSNAWSDARATFRAKFGLDQEVDLIVISSEEGVAKPDARIYQRTLDRLDVQAHEAIFVDNLDDNVAAAQALGIHGVRFESAPQALADIHSLLDGAGVLIT